jgi:hypothetical protein
MNYTSEMTEENVFDQDVKTMSYEELMATIRYLDEERARLSESIRGHNDQDDRNKEVEKILKRAA